MDSFSNYKQQLAVGSSVFLSLVSAVALGYYLAQRLGYSEGVAWTCALASGIILLLAEVVLVVLKLSRADRRQQAEAENGATKTVAAGTRRMVRLS